MEKNTEDISSLETAMNKSCQEDIAMEKQIEEAYNTATAMNNAYKAVQEAKGFCYSRDYKSASISMRKAIDLHPDLQYGLEKLIIYETLLYNSPVSDFGTDFYSLLHLHQSATNAEVSARCSKLIDYANFMRQKGYCHAHAALDYLEPAKIILTNQTTRLDYDHKREAFGFIDTPVPNCKSSSFRDQYLNWKPPHFKSEAKISRTEEAFSPAEVQNLHHRVFDEMPQRDRELSLPTELEKSNPQVFDEMPQRPHYRLLDKYGSIVCEGMKIGLDIAFVNISEKIRELDDPESFWAKVDGFMEQLAQLEEMGYNVDKLRERLETLRGHAERGRDEVEKIVSEVKEHETKVTCLRSRVLEIEAEIKESKDLIEARLCKIDGLKKDFTSLAKKEWK